MTPELQKEFNDKLVSLLKEYKVNIVPTLGLRLDEIPEEKKDGQTVIAEEPAKSEK